VTAAAEIDRGLDHPEIAVSQWRRFFGFADTDPCELVVLLPGKRAPWVAYATNADQCVRLMREGEKIRGGTGVYMVPNEIHPAIVARYPANTWTPADSGRVNDGEIVAVRCIYIDCDAERPKNISSTDTEKAAAYTLARAGEAFLVERLGDDWPLAFADSGNGYSVFLALAPFKPTKETSTKIERFLKALAARFDDVPGAKVDASVFNPARLCPAFGTVKTKGTDTPERPHRLTTFCCRPDVRRIPIEDL
jgi:hypothetical protein